MSGVSFGPWEMGLAAALVVLNAGLSLTLRLDLHRSLLVSAARMVVQLLLVGAVLRFIFGSGSLWMSIAILMTMLIAASWEVGNRQKDRLAGYWHYAIAGVAVSGSTMTICTFAMMSIASAEDWAAPRVVIPIVGIVLGTAMNATSIALNSMFEGIRTQRNAIEAQFALGRSRREAMRPMLLRAAHAGSIPVLNQMAGAGIITLPGIMSGQILAGQDPLHAAQSQIVLMFLLAAASLSSVVLAVELASKRLCDERDRLRLDRLR